ncbi:MAG: hypothetical protein JW934_05540 [Anaerolineae bacterium]|nr:hypothetical protein [Anaerolineae bacterium]
MIQLIVTANDELYEQLAQTGDGQQSLRATNVLDGFKLTTFNSFDRVIVDMKLHAADTLIETMHARPETSHIPLYGVKSEGAIPLELRRLCTDILEAGSL